MVIIVCRILQPDSRITGNSPQSGHGRVGDRAVVESCALGLLSPVGPAAAEYVDRSGPSKDLAGVRHTSPDEIFLPGIQRNPLSVDD